MPAAVRVPQKRSAAQVPVRFDPKPRPVEGMGDWTQLKGKDPDRHYVWVNKEDGVRGPMYYESLALEMSDGTALEYRIERYEQDGGVRPKGGKYSRQHGEPIEVMGYVLMSCPNELHEWIVENGPGGTGGLAYLRELEKRIANRSSAAVKSMVRPDGIPLTSPNGDPYFQFASEIGPLMPDKE